MNDWDIIELPAFETEFNRLVHHTAKTKSNTLSREEISEIMEDLIRNFRATGSFVLPKNCANVTDKKTGAGH